MGRKRRLSTPHKANNTEKEKARNAKELENELAKREREMVEPDVHIEEEEKDEVGEARFRFYGALKGLTEKKPEDSESESSLFDDEEHDEEDMFSDSQINFVQDRVRHELGKKYHDKDNGSYGFTSSNKFLSGLDSDRDDPKGDNPALSTKQSYVMKLFDRSVDLAQFDDVTPLYPICRSWVANQPKKPWEKKREAPPAPSWAIKEETEEEEEEEGPGSKKKTKEDGGTEEENGEVDTSDIEPSQIELKVIAKLPPPSYYVDLNAPSIRIPPPLPKVIEPLLSDEAKPAEELLPSQEELLGGHLTRWLQIKTSWLHASQKNEERYLKSRQLLQLMYNRTMKQAQ